MSYKAPFPHCDSLVLHAPGECQYCDHYPDEQKERIMNKVAFTGHEPKSDERQDPATIERPLETINKWHGNTPRPI